MTPVRAALALVLATLGVLLLGCAELPIPRIVGGGWRAESALDDPEMREWKALIEQAKIEASLGDPVGVAPGCGNPGGAPVISAYDPGSGPGSGSERIVVSRQYMQGRPLEELEELIVHEAQHAKNRRANPPPDDFEDEYTARRAQCDHWAKVQKQGQSGFAGRVAAQLQNPDGSPRPKEVVKRLLADQGYAFDSGHPRRREWREQEVITISLPAVKATFDYSALLALQPETAAPGGTGASVALQGAIFTTRPGRTRIEVSSVPVRPDAAKPVTAEGVVKAALAAVAPRPTSVVAERQTTMAGAEAFEKGVQTGDEQVFCCAGVAEGYAYRVMLFTGGPDALKDRKIYELTRRSLAPYTGEKASAAVRELGVAFDFPPGWSLSNIFTHRDQSAGRAIRIAAPRDSSGAGAAMYLTVLPVKPGGSVAYVKGVAPGLLFPGGQTDVRAGRPLLGKPSNGATVRFPVERPSKGLAPKTVPTVWSIDAVIRDEDLLELMTTTSEADEAAVAPAFQLIRASLSL